MMAEMAGWESRHIDYVLAFSQAPIDTDVYLHLPAGFHVDGKDENETLEKILYKNCQAEANCFDMLRLDLKIEVSNKKK